MDKKPIINIVEINKAISEKHKTFLDQAGNLGDKIEADRSFLISKVATHIGFILNSFVQEKIIDKIEDRSQGEMHLKMCLSRAGHDNAIYIISDGETIMICEASLMNEMGIMRPEHTTFRNVHSEDFDWTSFSTQLLDEIHAKIYERKRVMEKRIEQMWDVPEDDLVPKKTIRLRKPSESNSEPQIQRKTIRLKRPS